MERAPVLLLGQWLLPPAEYINFFELTAARFTWIAAVLLMALIAWVFWPVLRRSATARFWGAGMLLAVLPACAALPANRLLFFIGLGAMGLLAEFFAGGLAPGLRAWEVWANNGLTGLLLALHLIIAPALLPVMAFSPKLLGGLEHSLDGAIASLPDDSRLAQQTAVVVYAPNFADSSYIGLRHLKDENDTLKREVASAQVAVQEQRALADRTLGLQRLLDLRNSLNLKTEAAEIIGGAANPDFRTVTVNKGTNDGLRADMAVLAPAGVVGRVVAPSLRAAKVQLLIDRNAAAGAIVERTRAQGIVVGASEERLRMEYVSEVFDVLVGDIVVTSGIDGIYPKGFVIGRVEIVEKSGGAYRRIVVKPAVNFSGIEEVLVVTSPTPARESTGGVSE